MSDRPRADERHGMALLDTSFAHRADIEPVSVPTAVREALIADGGDPGWLDAVPTLAARAAERWDLVLGAPFETGMAGWTAAATTEAGVEVVLKLSYPHLEARDEAAGLAAWHGAGAVEVLDAHAEDWALLLARLRPGTTLQEEGLPPDEHLTVGAALLGRMGAVPVPAGDPFRDLAEVADGLAAIAAERIERVLPTAPIPVDAGLCRHAVDLLRTLPRDATRHGLAHGDLNPGNILRSADPAPGGDPSAGWLAIDPKPVHGDLAWDPWPLLTQVGDWTVVVPDPAVLADRIRLVADVAGLDPARTGAWCVARGVESGLWAASLDRWSGFRGADCDLVWAAGWATATDLLAG